MPIDILYVNRDTVCRSAVVPDYCGIGSCRSPNMNIEVAAYDMTYLQDNILVVPLSEHTILVPVSSHYLEHGSVRFQQKTRERGTLVNCT